MTAATPDDLATLAAEIAPTLIGLDRDEAQRRVGATDDRLSTRFADEGETVTLEFRFGRITATMRDGVVVAAAPG